MNIQLKQTENLLFQGINDQGSRTLIGLSGSDDPAAVRPMELVLLGLAGCSSIDIIEIFKKQRIEPTQYDVDVQAKRQNAVPALFEHILITFRIKGNISPEKAKRAVGLSLDKYCSVSKILEPTARIESKIILNGQAL